MVLFGVWGRVRGRACLKGEESWCHAPQTHRQINSLIDTADTSQWLCKMNNWLGFLPMLSHTLFSWLLMFYIPSFTSVQVFPLCPRSPTHPRVSSFPFASLLFSLQLYQTHLFIWLFAWQAQHVWWLIWLCASWSLAAERTDIIRTSLCWHVWMSLRLLTCILSNLPGCVLQLRIIVVRCSVRLCCHPRVPLWFTSPLISKCSFYDPSTGCRTINLADRCEWNN